MFVKEQYSPQPISANGTYVIPSGVRSLGGFLCTVTGSLTVTNNTGTVIVSSLPVTAGVYYPLPFFLGEGGSGSVVLSGGAAGTLGT